MKRKRKLRMGMIGGGNNAFIGAIHRIAAFMDNHIELVCGCFSADPAVSLASGRSYYLPDNRIYSNFQEMFDKETKLPENERMDFVSIVTPNHLHFEPAMRALELGFHVIIDKPMTFSLQQAHQLKAKVEETGLIFALTHTYSGYPAVKDAKMRFAKGDFGKIRKIYVEYPQGWLSKRIELEGNNNAGWRTDPKRSGKAGSMGDIGTHAWHLAEYITGLKVTELCADLKAFVPGRPIDDDGAALLRYENGATGVLIASQVAAGEANGLHIRVYGENGGIEWTQMNPNILTIKWSNRPTEIINVGNNASMDSMALYNTRTPAGHPEGYLEAFANIYRNFALTIQAKIDGNEPKQEWLDFPNVNDGLRGMQFIETIVTSGYDENKKWIKWID